MNRFLFCGIICGWLCSGLACRSGARPCTANSECDQDQRCIQGQCRGAVVGADGGFTSNGGGQGGGVGQGGGTGSGGGGGGDLYAEDAGVQDASLPFYDGGCGPIDAGNPPYPRRCSGPSTNECGGATDTFLTTAGVPDALLNTTRGNGFDDDCDGLVDEGCFCDGNGTTKDCYLVPATQVNQSTGQPVGWCTSNAHGSVDCAGGELATWSGVCRGAQQPARYDSCGPGDFDCDVLSVNSQVQGCECATQVNCPTAALQLAPYPPTNAIPLVDGTQWIVDVNKRATSTNWTWTVLGGDCDNVLPFPTFAIYATASASGRKGARTPVKFDSAAGRYLATPGEPLISIQAANFGDGIAGGQPHAAFGLSGDYVVQGEFTVDGARYTCTQKVEVRAPGIRAELCWDSVGTNDIDLHFARLQGISCTQGWDTTCDDRQDCYWNPGAGRCAGIFSPPWGYTNSANSACQGWSSRRSGSCTNPRLDRDTVRCSRSQSDPTNATSFCGPENINLDNPKDGDRFVIGVNHYETYDRADGTSKPHVNLYCNGRRVLSVGYNPATGQTTYPVLKRAGEDSSGDFWTVATIGAHVAGGQLTSCDVTPVPSRHADVTRDGPVSTPGNGKDICVDSKDNQSPAPNQFSYGNHQFVENPAQNSPGGGQPVAIENWCKH